MIALRYQGRQSSNRAEAISADLARHPDLESGTFYGIVKPDELVKVTLRRIARLLVVFLSISQRSAARHCYNENPYK